MKKTTLDMPLWGKPEDCELYVNLKREDRFLAVIWTFFLCLSISDMFAVMEKWMPTWTLVVLLVICFLIPIVFRPRSHSKWRCPNCQTAFPYRNILARVDHIYGGYIQELTEQKIPFVSPGNIVFPSKCPTCGQSLYEQSYGKLVSEIMKPTIKILIAAVIIFGVLFLLFIGAIIIISL